MPVAGDHPNDDLIQEGLDSRLDAESQARLESHLADCVDCKRAWEALRWIKDQGLKAHRPDPPANLARQVAEALDAEDARLAPAPPAKSTGWRVALPIRAAAAALAVMAIAAVALFIAGRPDVPTLIARDHSAFARGDLPLGIRTAEVSAMEAYLSRERLPFPARVLDLAMMKYRLVGGSTRSTDGRPSVLLVYKNEEGHLLLCRMYLGSLDDLPAPQERHEHDGVTFFVYGRQELTLVFWPEGHVVCVLSGEGGPSSMLPLAFAKAMKAQVAQGAVPWHP